jgi:hypothetical protein
MPNGRPTAVPFHEEKEIADCLKLMEKWGFGLSKKRSSGDDRPVCQ